MKVMIGENRIVLAGKAWQIKAVLNIIAKQHKLVKDWIDSRRIIE